MVTAMIATMGSGAVLAEEEQTLTNSTTVKYEVGSSYTWTVPAVINFGSNEGVNQTVIGEAETANGDKVNDGSKVTVSDNVIGVGEQLEITAAGSGENQGFVIIAKNTTNNTTEKLNYTVKVAENQENLKANGTVLTVPAGQKSADAKLTFTLTTKKDGSEIAGNYEGTVTYTAAVVDATQE